ncbi:hypothetical protein [Methylobacter sp. YRD-M1]|uniref:hypothetical protein n=1 Tax=Methylobacter sp. YRD-M1 TaxID=2911520 RepID=UPI00227A015B|nr:hypothetical protein [Methylobacter sp. YRD-M1]WAK02448.1 hypothetical protein LZ558_01290 [Methylobacter sp. YRD-M1]
MSTRVSKKMMTAFESINASGAILMINVFEPQILTTKIFLEAIHQNNLPHVVIGNKIDLIDDEELPKLGVCRTYQHLNIISCKIVMSSIILLP